jgi:drug/metabolite transporter (DMT)-like permease
MRCSRSTFYGIIRFHEDHQIGRKERDLMGEVYALAAAVVWAMAVMFLRKSGESVTPFGLNLFRVGITTPLLALSVLAAGQAFVQEVPVKDYLILAGSGIIAIAVSDTLLHHSINLIGAGLAAIAWSVYAPVVTLMAFILIDEKLGPWQFGGMALVITAVIAAARHKPPEGTARRQIVLGVIWGVLAMVAVGFGIVIAKPVLLRTPVLWATAVRQAGSLVVIAVVAAVSPQRKRLFSVFRPSRSWRFSVTAALLGSYCSLLLWVAGFKYALSGVAAILNQTSTIFILLLASVFLREPITKRKAAASALAIAGILMVTLGPRA